jgi:RNA polymerase sigma factor (TIGR02999 family)
MKDLRRLLEELDQGREGASERLSVLLYEEVRRIARRRLAGERPDHTLQPTALANEAYLRLAAGDDGGFASRGEFLAAASVAIRRVLVEHARRRARLKRGGDRKRVDVDLVQVAEAVPDETLLDLDEALQRLEGFSPVHAQTVGLHVFAGMTLEEIALHRSVSVSTIGREWRFARAWLRGELEDPGGC